MPLSSTRALRRRAALLALAAGLAGGAAAHAVEDDTVVVLTSYPEELTVQYQAAFEQLHPGKRVEILWRQSADARAYLQRSRGEVDVYWTPSPGNFADLHAQGRFAPLSLDRDALPAAIGGRPIADPAGHFTAFELAGHGIAYNSQAVARLGQPLPRDWADLAAPAYAGQVQIPIPGPMGFSSVVIEAVLQGYGWTHGWALLSAIAGNAVFGGDDRPQADDPLVAGTLAARMTIDFFTASAIAGGAPLGFAYPPKTAYNPAHIAIFNDAPHPENARAFVAFALSDAGQQILLHPDIRRLPARKPVYDAFPALPARPFADDALGYDAPLGRDRQGLVAALFRHALVQRHDELAELWARLHRAERDGQADAPAVRQARALLSAAPLAEDEQASPTLRRAFAFADRRAAAPQPAHQDGHGTHQAPGGDTDDAPSRAQIEADWDAQLEQRLAAARAALQPWAR